MKLTIPNCRINYPTKPVVFEQILPLRLRTKVSGKTQKTNNVACVQEMFVLFACMKKNDFSNDTCSEEIKKLNKCYITHLQESKKRVDLMRTGKPDPGSKTLNHMQLNTLLRRYP